MTVGPAIRRGLSAFGYGILFGMVADLFVTAPIARATGLADKAASWVVILVVAMLTVVVAAIGRAARKPGNPKEPDRHP
jgi:predicted membrane protein